MFPDIALYGTTAPDPVPSSSVKVTNAFEQAFADLLALPHPPTPESATGLGDDPAVVSLPPVPVNDVPTAAIPVQSAPVTDLATPAVVEQGAPPNDAKAAVSLPCSQVNGATEPFIAMQCANGDGVPTAIVPALDAHVDDVTMPPVPAKGTSVAIRVEVEDPSAAGMSEAQPDKKPEERAGETAPYAVAGTLAPALPILDSDETDSSHIAAPAPAASDADPASTLVLAPAVEPDVLVVGLTDESSIQHETNSARHDMEPASVEPVLKAPALPPVPTAPALTPADFAAPTSTAPTSTAPASTEPPKTIEAPHRIASSDDLGPPSLTPRVTRLEEARERLAAIAALLAETEQASVSPGHEIPAPPSTPSLRGISVAAIKDVLPETEPQTVSKSPSTNVGDAGPTPAVLHVPTQKPVIPGMREAALVWASSASPHVALPNESATAHSIVQTLRMQATRGGGTAVITLAPKYLGSVTVALRVTDGGVTATLHAENSSVRAWIESNVPLLRDGLAEQGLRLERVVVADAADAHHKADDHQSREPEQRPPAPARRPRRREEASFDVVV